MSINIYTAKPQVQHSTLAVGIPAAEQIALPPSQPDIFFGTKRPPIPHSGTIALEDLDDDPTREEELEERIQALQLRNTVLAEIAYEAIGAAGWQKVPQRVLDKIRVMARLNPPVKVLPADPPERNRGKQLFIDAVAKLQEAVEPSDNATDMFAKKRERLSEWREQLQTPAREL